MVTVAHPRSAQIFKYQVWATGKTWTRAPGALQGMQYTYTEALTTVLDDVLA